MVRTTWLAWIATLALLEGCTAPSVRVIHSPFYPDGGQVVDFEATATSEHGVAKIEIQRFLFGRNGFCAAWVAGECVPLNTPTVQTIKECTFPDRPASAICRATAGPFGDGTFLQYGAIVIDGRGNDGLDQWVGIAVGLQPDPNEPVAVYTRAPSDDAVDLVFIPVDYNNVPGRTYRDFVDDVRTLVVEAYLRQPQITDDRTRWNFYVNPLTGGLLSSNVSGKVLRSTTHPLNWERVAPMADAAGYMHHLPREDWRNFARFNDSGTSEFTVNVGNRRTALHETGHAVFGLSDEYCCDGGMIATSWPHPNLFDDQPACEASAVDHGRPPTDCQQLSAAWGMTTVFGFCGGHAGGVPLIGGTNQKWRSDALGDLMGCAPGVDGGVLDAARIRWYYDNL